MRTCIWVAAFCSSLCVSQRAFADIALPEGTWDFNGTGYEGKLVVKLGDGNKVTGTVYDQPISGSFDPGTGRLNFVRLCVPNDPSTYQAHKGYLFVNDVGDNKRYTLAGTFYNIGNTAEMGWFAQITVGEPPKTGQNTPGVELLDAVMVKYLKKIGCTAGSLAVSRGRDKRILYSRGYGWSDRERTVPLEPDTPIVIASCDKQLTAAAIRKLAWEGRLDLNDSVLKVLDIKPAGQVVDNRVWDITINHLLDHKAGWQGEPVDRAWQAANGKQYPIEAETLLSYTATQTLAWTPGEKAEYDSFGYNTLKRVVARASGRSYVDYLRHDLCRPFGVRELRWVRHGAPQNGEPPQLWNGLIMEDPEGYRMGVSMPALCTFMSCYWAGGEPRDRGVRNDAWAGGWDNCTCWMLWRNDQINVAFAFNGRAEGTDDVVREVHEAINQLVKDGLLPSDPSGR